MDFYDDFKEVESGEEILDYSHIDESTFSQKSNPSSNQHCHSLLSHNGIFCLLLLISDDETDHGMLLKKYFLCNFFQLLNMMTTFQCRK